MEKRKLLLVIISVGVFLVVVIGASLLIFAPRKPAPSAIASGRAPIPAGAPLPADTAGPAAPATVDASEWVRNPQSVGSLQTPPAAPANTRGDVIIIYGDNPNQNTAITGTPEAGPDSSGSLVITVPKPAAVAPPAPETVAQPVPATKPAAKPAPATASAKPAAKPAAKPGPTKIYEDYWVQTGAYSAQKGAGEAKARLAEKGIKAILEVKTLNEKTYYRVRLGPYISKNEADYWLSLVKSIDGFGESYVSLVKTRR